MYDDPIDMDGGLIDVGGLRLHDLETVDSPLRDVVRMLLDRTDDESIASFNSRM